MTGCAVSMSIFLYQDLLLGIIQKKHLKVIINLRTNREVKHINTSTDRIFV